MRNVGVVGLGTMGLGIAQVFAQAGLTVLATDAVGAARDSARERLGAALGARVQAGKMTPEERDATLRRLIVVDGPGSMGAAGLVIEAVVENLGTKRDLFAKLEKGVAPDAVLATNTSSLSVGAMAEGLARPERLLGLHFFNPAPAQRLVELVRHAGSAPSALDVARKVAEAAGKRVVEAPDRPGFIVNRCARPFYGEALVILEEGRSAGEIDAAMLSAGYRIGPFSLIDLIGADINLAATRSVSQAMGGHPRYHVFAAQEAAVAEGRLGRKTGRGFLVPDQPGGPPADADRIIERIEAALVNEAGWFLAEGEVAPEAIDEAVRLGLSFPRGPFEILAARGAGPLRAVLDALDAGAPGHLKGRYALAPILTEAP
jgi:3-hydroxybutyryl-CoA dehydrogenase